MNLHAAPAWTLQGARTCTFSIIKHFCNLWELANPQLQVLSTICQALASSSVQSPTLMAAQGDRISMKVFSTTPVLPITILRLIATTQRLLLFLRMKGEKKITIRILIQLIMSKIQTL